MLKYCKRCDAYSQLIMAMRDNYAVVIDACPMCLDTENLERVPNSELENIGQEFLLSRAKAGQETRAEAARINKLISRLPKL